MKITEFEAQSALWQKIETELNGRLAIMREKNDSDLEPLKTAELRGQIRMLKEILGWAIPTPTIIGD